MECAVGVLSSVPRRPKEEKTVTTSSVRFVCRMDECIVAYSPEGTSRARRCLSDDFTAQ